MSDDNDADLEDQINEALDNQEPGPDHDMKDDAPDKTAAFYTFDGGKAWTAAKDIKTVTTLPPAIYSAQLSDSGPQFKTSPPPKSRIHLDDDQHAILKSVDVFWDAAPKYQALGFPHKRGLLLFGPPGTGKTTCMRAIGHAVINRGGYVLLMAHPPWIMHCIQAIRATSPTAPIMVQVEDVDRWAGGGSESTLLDAMDGSFRGDHLLWCATTNHMEKISERMKRPSRFDMKLEIGFPNPQVREHYIRSVLPQAKTVDVSILVSRTHGKSIADIKEEILQFMVFNQQQKLLMEGKA